MCTPKPWFRSQNDTWYVCFHGEQVPLAKGQRSKREAEDAFHQLMGTGPDGPCSRSDAAARRLKVAEVLDQFLDWVQQNLDWYEWHRHFLQQFATGCGHLSVQSLKPIHVTNWLAEKATWGPTTRNRVIGELKQVFNWAVEQGLLTANPINTMKKPTAKRRERTVLVIERLASRSGRNTAGADGLTLAAVRTSPQGASGFLIEIANSLQNGTYRPAEVRRFQIPKSNGKMRPLAVPTVSDRIAQMVVKLMLEPHVEPHFHKDSYGYRPGKSALDAVGVTRQRCWRRNWVIDLDIKGFFDNLDWDLVSRAVRHHTQVRWILFYVERWLGVPVQHADGRLEERTKGSPQGSVISPLLSNLFMHYAFDEWLRRNFADVQFARYADDAVVHARSLAEAEKLLTAIRSRLAECGLELHPEKTRIVYCKDDDRRGTHEHTSFDFLGYTFRPRRARNRWGKLFISFLPGVSNKAANSIRETIRSWRIGATRNNQTRRKSPAS